MVTADQLIDAACERAGHSDFGSDSWRPGLEILVRELDRDVVQEDGRARIHEEFVAAMWNRLRVADYLRTHPEVAEQRIERPLFILGMPRTGTTLASYLLDRDPDRRSLLNWEAADSVPPPTSATLRSDERCLTKLKGQQEIFAFLMDAKITLPHWEWADGPTECIFVQNQDFKAFYWDAFLPTPTYADWLLDGDMTSAYTYEKSVLQILQSHAPGRWSLKMPSHAVFLDTLLEVFPDARLIWAHRDPYSVLGSLCGAQRMAKESVCGANIDREAIGRDALVKLAAHVDRATATRERVGDDRFFDLHYADLVRDPIGQMQRIYAWDGQDLSAETETAMRGYVEENPAGRHGKHVYSLDEYGLTVEAAKPYFEDYIARYGVEVDHA